MLQWLRRHGCPWDSGTSYGAVTFVHLELLQWARQQQSPCPWWSHPYDDLFCWKPSSCMLVYLAQQRAPLGARHLAEARAAAIQMTTAVISLRPALPDRTPHELALTIVSLAFPRAAVAVELTCNAYALSAEFSQQ